MRMRNNTDLADERVRHLVKEACRGINTANMVLTIRNSSKKRPTGRIWTDGGKGSVWTPYWGRKGKWVKAAIVVSLPRDGLCDLDFRRHGQSTLVYRGQSREAALVNIVAHELFHHKQASQGKRYSQAKADGFALKQLDRLGLLNGEPTHFLGPTAQKKVIREDLRRNGWVWSKKHHCYVSVDDQEAESGS